MKYSDKLRDPRWQKIRLKVMERDGFKCQACFNEGKTLNVHHGYYEKGLNPWEYNLNTLHTVCEDCHKTIGEITKDIYKTIAVNKVKNLPKLYKELCKIIKPKNKKDLKMLSLKIDREDETKPFSNLYQICCPIEDDLESLCLVNFNNNTLNCFKCGVHGKLLNPTEDESNEYIIHTIVEVNNEIL